MSSLNNTIVLKTIDDISKNYDQIINKNINNVLQLYTNVDYENEFNKLNLYIDYEIGLDLNYFWGGKIDFSKILNVDKIKYVNIPLVCYEEIKPFKNLEYIKLEYVCIYDFTINKMIRDFIKNNEKLKVMEFVEETYDKYVLAFNENKENYINLFINNNLTKIIINGNIYYRSSIADIMYTSTNNYNYNWTYVDDYVSENDNEIIDNKDDKNNEDNKNNKNNNDDNDDNDNDNNDNNNENNNIISTIKNLINYMYKF